jgi:hypothetical protein
MAPPSSGPGCPNRLFDLRRDLYDNSERNSITTLFRQVSDVWLGYTPEQHHLGDDEILSQWAKHFSRALLSG